MADIKTENQINKMRNAGALAAATLDMLSTQIKPGITTDQINQLAHDYIIEHGGYPASLGYNGFPKSLCTSVNHVVCHGIPNDKPLKDGDIVNVDLVVNLDGYHGDTSKMFAIGRAKPYAERLIRITHECLYIGIKLVKPGVRIGDIGAAIQKHAEANHYSVVREYCGHGIGETMHADPQILHYGVPGTGVSLQPGMTFTIEPMINLGKRHIKLLPDDWTVITKDRKLSAQWEHTILVTETGYEILTWREEEAGKIERIG